MIGNAQNGYDGNKAAETFDFNRLARKLTLQLDSCWPFL